MNLDEALMIATKGRNRGASFDELHEALDVFAEEIKRLQEELSEALDYSDEQKAEIINLNEEIDEIVLKYEFDFKKLEIATRKLADEANKLNKDWCDDDEGVKQQALRVLPAEKVEGDTWHVPRMGGLAEMMADEVELLRAKLQAETAAADNLNEMLRRTGYGQGQIDAYDAQCEEIEKLNAKLEEAKDEIIQLILEIENLKEKFIY